MDCQEKKHFTLNELKQIALGSSVFDHTSQAALHLLVDTLLEKLNCKNEKVTLTGSRCHKLSEWLEESKPQPFLVNSEQIEKSLQPLEDLKFLEMNVQNVENKVETHFLAISLLPVSKCEDSFSLPENEMALRIYQNCAFMNDLNCILSDAPMQMMKRLNLSFDEMSFQMHRYMTIVTAAYRKAANLEPLVFSLKREKLTLQKDHEILKVSMRSLQQAMDKKVTKCEILPVKAEIKKLLERVDAKIDEYTKPRVRASILVECKAANEKQAEVKKPNNKIPKCKKECVKNHEYSPTLMERVRQVDEEHYPLKKISRFFSASPRSVISFGMEEIMSEQRRRSSSKLKRSQ